MKTIKVHPKLLHLCAVKVENAADMSREETAALMNWCDCQTESLWDHMSLQEILNVYRVSAEWDTWEDWAQDDPQDARYMWNKAVIDPENKMKIDA
ncbi:hypothetical protein QYR01_10520 [Brucella anthropi]|uniref:hypothetical protein n=1 Tax=Brucella anthropi TaxID=529 RepID=UPI00267357F7|nr:hypothetical protein [Brucella anthropi]WKT94529.1 hypothetical protein QYR01_10520 [Brucella anthropi]